MGYQEDVKLHRKAELCKVVKLAAGGSVINGVTMSNFGNSMDIKNYIMRVFKYSFDQSLYLIKLKEIGRHILDSQFIDIKL